MGRLRLSTLLVVINVGLLLLAVAALGGPGQSPPTARLAIDTSLAQTGAALMSNLRLAPIGAGEKRRTALSELLTRYLASVTAFGQLLSCHLTQG